MPVPYECSLLFICRSCQLNVVLILDINTTYRSDYIEQKSSHTASFLSQILFQDTHRSVDNFGFLGGVLDGSRYDFQ